MAADDGRNGCRLAVEASPRCAGRTRAEARGALDRFRARGLRRSAGRAVMEGQVNGTDRRVEALELMGAGKGQAAPDDEQVVAGAP